MRRTTITLAALAAFSTTALCWAGDDDEIKPLSIGDPAPEIDIAHWLKGEQVEEFEDGKVYVMEFWATWCGPCIASMPHISSLQEKYEDYDVTFVGVSDEDLQTVVNFLFKTHKDGKTQHERTQYTLTTDPDKSVYKSYMTAAGQRGIPTAFIVGKDSRVEWIGHPMSIDDPLEAVVKDSWDRKAFKTKWDKENKAELERTKTMRTLEQASAEQDWPKVIEILDEMIAEGGNTANYELQRFFTQLIQMNQPKKAYAFGHTFIEKNWDNAMMLNQVAWLTATEQGIKERDLDFAMKAAMRASELTDGKDAAILDTVARIHFDQGDYPGAAAWQFKAVEALTGDEPFADELRENLEKYQKQVDKVEGR